MRGRNERKVKKIAGIARNRTESPESVEISVASCHSDLPAGSWEGYQSQGDLSQARVFPIPLRFRRFRAIPAIPVIPAI
jgi:hypothetical protein